MASVQYLSQIAAAEVQAGLRVADAVLSGALDQLLPATEETVTGVARTENAARSERLFDELGDHGKKRHLCKPRIPGQGLRPVILNAMVRCAGIAKCMHESEPLMWVHPGMNVIVLF